MFAGLFSRILKMERAQYDVPLGRIHLLTAADLAVLREWNHQETAAVPKVSLHDRFREIAAVNACSIAIVDGSLSITYGELDNQSDRLASWLVGRWSLKSEDAVGIVSLYFFHLLS